MTGVTVTNLAQNLEYYLPMKCVIFKNLFMSPLGDFLNMKHKDNTYRWENWIQRIPTDQNKPIQTVIAQEMLAVISRAFTKLARNYFTN